MDRKVVFPLADGVKAHANKKIKKNNAATNLFTEGLATTIFILYVYFTTDVLAKYVFAPILRETKEFILIVVVVLFLLLNYVINHKDIRKRFLHV